MTLTGISPAPAALPGTIWQAMRRGAVGHCPRCDAKGLFHRYLKPVSHCRACGHDWSRQQADDFPPYVAITVTGHVMAPVMIELGALDGLAMWAKMAIAVAIAVMLIFALLQPAKGAIIALQWWMGMHGFLPSGKQEAEGIGES